jgi:phospholipid transport system substrate-binding protein
MRVPGVLALAAAFVLWLAPGLACAADPAAANIEAFQSELLATMKAGPGLGPQGRFKRLTPVVERAFDLPVMTRFAVGADWARMSEADHRALVASFTRLTAASYAKNFNRWSGEKLTVDANVVTRGTDKIVRAQILPTSGAPTDLMYRMHQDGAAWKIVDVYYGGISQLVTRRSDFAAPLAAGGALGLEKHLDALVDKLLR